MDSKLTNRKLSGVVKSYRKKAPNTSQLIKTRNLTTMGVNRALKVCANEKVAEKLKNGLTTSRPSPPRVLAVVKPANSKTVTVNVQRTKPKLSKWDFKGRLAYTEQELVICKNNLKNAASRGNELAQELAKLLEQDKLSKERADGAVEIYNKLTEERDSLVYETENNQEMAESLKKDVDALSAELGETVDRLKEFKDNYENHDSKMSELLEEVERVKEENAARADSIRSMKTHNKELEIALNGIQEKRQEMLDAIRLLKGDD